MGDRVSLTILATCAAFCIATSPPARAATTAPAPPSEETNGAVTITVWLMFNEPWTGHRDGDFGELLEKFNAGLADTGVTVLNARKLMGAPPEAWNDGLYKLDELRQQQGVLECLTEFVREDGRDNVVINVRFVYWWEALSLLDNALREPRKLSTPTPDIVQIGSTWRARYSPYAHPNSIQRLPHPALRKHPTLRYILDVRLLLYWKQGIGGNSNSLDRVEQGPSVREISDWGEVIERLHELNASQLAGQSHSDEAPMPFVFHTEPGSPDLMHDYVPLVFAGNGKFLDGNGQVVLSSNEALKVPRLLRRSVWQSMPGAQAYKLFEFSSESQAVIQEKFFNAEYGAAILPFNALSRFHEHLSQNRQQIRDPWEHLGIGVLPCMFHGGSDLLVTKWVTGSPEFWLFKAVCPTNGTCLRVVSMGRCFF